MRERLIKIVISALFFQFFMCSFVIGGEIKYLKENNAFEIIGFSELSPATLKVLHEYDKKNALNKITYIPEEQKYSVNSSIWIGTRVSPCSTFFQIGSPENKNETLVIAGDIWIKPPMESVARSDGRKAYVNRLTAGHPDNPKIKPKILFECEKNGQYGIMLGHRRKKGTIRGGDLFLYNTLVSAAIQDRKHDFKTSWRKIKELDMTTGFYGNEIRLIGSTFSCFTSTLIYGLEKDTKITVKGCVFENGHVVFGNVLKARNCIFRKIYFPFSGGELTDCVFEDNIYNWSFDGKHINWPMILLNCEIGASKKINPWVKNKITSRRWPVFPDIVQRHTMVFNICDNKGKPVPGALVELKCEKHPEAVFFSTALTNKEGETPRELINQPIIVTLKKTQITDIPGKPSVTFYGYHAHITTNGYKPKQIFLSSEELYKNLKKNRIIVITTKIQLSP